MKKKILALLMAASFGLVSCGQATTNESSNVSNDNSSNTNAQSEKKVVYTSFYPIYDLTKQIAGDKFEVKALSNLTTEAHDWEPSAKDIAKLDESELLITNGAGMESWVDAVKDSSKVEILDTTENVDKIARDNEEADHDHEDADHDHEEGEHHHHHHGKYDPHTWLAPENGKLQAKAICDKLSEIDPDNKSYYEDNYKVVEKDLDSIISEYKDKFENAKNDKFVVPHEAFGYLCREFNLEQIPLTGLLSTSEPDLKAMNDVIEEVKNNDINTIFYEEGGSDKSAKTIADEIGGKVDTLNTMEFVSDKQLEDEVHYQDILRDNLSHIYESLK
ncbi:MAG: zinc ABC transporter substrate-binding protein [Tissierellia bacterium]|nr:zinc ABC transporter substrate-binding protein [Tissierellia bacterium]